MQALENKGIWTAVSTRQMTTDSLNEFSNFGYSFRVDSLSDFTALLMRPQIFFQAVSTHLNKEEIVEPNKVVDELSTSCTSPYTYTCDDSPNNLSNQSNCFFDGPFKREKAYSVSSNNKGFESNLNDCFLIYSYIKADPNAPARGLSVLRNAPNTFAVNFLNSEENKLPFLATLQALESSGALPFVSDVGDSGFKLTPHKALLEYGYTFSAEEKNNKSKLYFNPLTTWTILLNAHRIQGKTVVNSENSNNN